MCHILEGTGSLHICVTASLPVKQLLYFMSPIKKVNKVYILLGEFVHNPSLKIKTFKMHIECFKFVTVTIRLLDVVTHDF